MNLTALHQRMVRNVFLNIEILLNDGVKSLSEYDVQSLAFLYYARALLNTPFRVEREREHKVDCVVYEGDEPCMLYEMKTLFKAHERLNLDIFNKDISKLVGLLSWRETARAYLIIAGARDKFARKKLDQDHFFAKHLNGDQKWYPHDLKNGQRVRLRPSKKQRGDRSVLMTWEIKVASV